MPLAKDSASFLSRYNLHLDALETAQLDWTELEAVYADHEASIGDLDNCARYIVDSLRTLPEVHSIRYRVKNPEHLVAKIIRKKLDHPERDYSLAGYRSTVTDLLGIRALHLFKDDWLPIHTLISGKWEQADEMPTANIRRGDDDSHFKEHGCKVHEHEAGYRSVHYLIRSNPAKQTVIAELQVRTLFEEAWCEIDHLVRYPHVSDHPMLAGYLGVFNRMAGGADEMGLFVRQLKQHLEDASAERNKVEAELTRKLEELDDAISKLKVADKEKELLKKRVGELSAKQFSAPLASFPIQS
ncbi:MAG: hypothetical protein QM757_35560 [Paludibaculum sp.]